MASETQTGIVISFDEKGKGHFCLYCGAMQKRIYRHLQGIHKNEEEIKNLANLRGEDLQLKLSELKALGNHNHNVQTMKRNCGILVVARKPGSNVKPTDYSPCKDCYKWIIKEQIFAHRKTCKPFSKSSEDVKMPLTVNPEIVPQEIAQSQSLNPDIGKDHISSFMSAKYLVLRIVK